MAGQVFTLPPRQTGAGAFTEGMSPFLVMAFEQMLKRKFQDQERQKAQQRIQQFAPGLFTTAAQQTLASEQPSMGALGTIPERYKRILQKEVQTQPYQLDIEKAKQYPGLDFSEMGIPYKVPQPNLFENLTIDEEGNPIIKIGERKIPLKSIGKTSATFAPSKETDEGYENNLNAAIQAIQKGKDPIAVFQRMAGAYSKKSGELKRILLQQKKETLTDIIRAVKGNE